METKAVFFKEIKPRNPYLIGGLPGIGYVAKFSTDYIVQELKAELVGELYSPHFPPYVIIKKDGTVELMRNEFYFWKNKNGESDVIFFTGNTQAVSPEGQYKVAEEVLKAAKAFGVKQLITLAAFATERHIDKPRVFCAATSQRVVDEIRPYNVVPMDEGNISGINGLLFGLARLMDIDGLCLLGETSVYSMPGGRAFIDAKAAQAVLEVLTQILKVQINMKPLEDQAKATEEFIRKLEEMERQYVEAAEKKPELKEKQYYI